MVTGVHWDMEGDSGRVVPDVVTDRVNGDPATGFDRDVRKP